jgi:hypothetical protein
MADKFGAPKLGPIAEAIIRSKTRIATEKAKLPPAALVGYTQDGRTLGEQQLSDSSLLQDVTEDRLTEQRKMLAALGTAETAKVNAMAVEEKKKSGALLRGKQVVDNQPWWKFW